MNGTNTRMRSKTKEKKERKKYRKSQYCTSLFPRFHWHWHTCHFLLAGSKHSRYEKRVRCRNSRDMRAKHSIPRHNQTLENAGQTKDCAPSNNKHQTREEKVEKKITQKRDGNEWNQYEDDTIKRLKMQSRQMIAHR